jgi:hypothetical protein
LYCSISSIRSKTSISLTISSGILSIGCGSVLFYTYKDAAIKVPKGRVAYFSGCLWTIGYKYLYEY